jgi:LysR family glycine cleavage system transcriptional activator
VELLRRNLPLNAMRAFEAAARHCHLRRAAAELGVTHGAVSRQVRQLEEQLGILLFDRSRNRLTLTQEGNRLAQAVGEALDRLTEGALSVDPASLPGELVLAAPPSISACWLLAMIGEFNQSYPEIEIRLDNILPMQRELPAEIEVAVCFGEPIAPKKVVRELFREKYGPVVSPSLLPTGGSVLEPSELLRLPLIHDRHGRWQRWLSNNGLEQREARTNLYVQDSYLGICAARDGCGVFLADRVEVSTDLRNGSLVALGGQTVEAQHSHYLVTGQPGVMSARAQIFTEYLGRALSTEVTEEVVA